MSPLKRTSGFFLLCLLTYGLLIAPWPGVMDVYRAGFRAGGNFLFGSFGSAGAASFQPLLSSDLVKDTRIVLRKRRPPFPEADVDIQSGLTGYRPTAFLIALVLATPIHWSRRWRALLWGLLGVNAFIALRVGLLLLNVFSDQNILAIYSFSPFWKGLLQALTLILFNAPATHYTGPMFVWFLVTFRRGDLKAIFATVPRSVRRKLRSEAAK